MLRLQNLERFEFNLNYIQIRIVFLTDSSPYSERASISICYADTGSTIEPTTMQSTFLSVTILFLFIFTQYTDEFSSE